MVMEKMKIMIEISKWPWAWIDLRLYTAYGSEYWSYIARHPLVFMRDVSRYLQWCCDYDRDREK